MELKREEPRIAAAGKLLELILWLTFERPTFVMKMKDDNVEAASYYVLQSDPPDLMLTISEHLKKKIKILIQMVMVVMI